MHYVPSNNVLVVLLQDVSIKGPLLSAQTLPLLELRPNGAMSLKS